MFGRSFTSVLLIVALLGGCATSGLHHLPAEKRGVLGRLGMATAHFAPEIIMDITVGKGQGAARGAAYAATGTIEGGLQSGDGFAFLLSLLLVPVVAAGGAVYGAVAGDTEEDVKRQVAPLDTLLYAMELQRLLTAEVLQHTQRSSQQIARSDLQGSSGNGQWADYRGEIDLDSVLEVGIRKIRFEDEGLRNAEVRLQIDGFARLVQVSDGAVLMEQEYPYWSIKRDLAVWSRNQGALARKELEIAFNEIAGKIVDDFFIPVHELPKGLDPLGATKPLPSFCLFCQALLDPLPTSRPVLCWNPFPDNQGESASSLTSDASAVVYDLNVSGLFDQTSFTRYDIDRNCYQLERPLAPCQLSRWQVRARFEVGQTIYATPWVSDQRNRMSTRCP